MVIISTFKNIFEKVVHVAFQWHAMTQNDTRLNQPIERITLLRDAFGKQVCHMNPQCSNHRSDIYALYNRDEAFRFIPFIMMNAV